MLPEIRLACLRISGAFLCRQTKKPSQGAGGPGEGRDKGRAFALNANLPYAANFCDTWDYAASRSVPKATVFRSVSCSS